MIESDIAEYKIRLEGLIGSLEEKEKEHEFFDSNPSVCFLLID
jgi:hypothetical protein